MHLTFHNIVNFLARSFERPSFSRCIKKFSGGSCILVCNDILWNGFEILSEIKNAKFEKQLVQSVDFEWMFSGQLWHSNFPEQCHCCLCSQYGSFLADWEDKCIDNEYCWSDQGLASHNIVCHHIPLGESFSIDMLWSRLKFTGFSVI